MDQVASLRADFELIPAAPESLLQLIASEPLHGVIFHSDVLTGQNLVTIGANFFNLTWKEGFSIHLPANQVEPISSTHKLYDVQSKVPGGAADLEDSAYVEVGVLQNGSTNHCMVVNRRCTSSETREVTITGNLARDNNLYS